MGRFIHSQTGVVVNVADAKDGRFVAPLWQPHDGADGSAPKADDPAGDSTVTADYSRLKVDELKAEIERRNASRDAADLLSTEGRKPELVAVLVADDADGQQ